MTEQTLLILKPDAIQRGLELKILERIHQTGLVLPSFYKTRASRDVLTEHYVDVLSRVDEARGRAIIEYMMSGPIIVSIVAGDNAIATVRARCGDRSDPSLCAPGTIRFDYSNETAALATEQGRSIRNLVHSSDSLVSAEREIGLWFNKYFHL